MKMIAFMMGLMVNPVDNSDLMKLDLSIQEPVKTVHMCAYNDQDVLVELKNYKIQNDIVSIYVKEHIDYQLVINNVHYITVSPMTYEIVDERDIDISCDGDYEMINGVLMFNLNNLTVK